MTVMAILARIIAKLRNQEFPRAAPPHFPGHPRGVYRGAQKFYKSLDIHLHSAELMQIDNHYFLGTLIKKVEEWYTSIKIEMMIATITMVRIKSRKGHHCEKALLVPGHREL